MFQTIVGSRKLLLGFAYLLSVSGIAMTSLLTGKGDLYGVAALGVSMATGVAAIIWGNVKVAQAEAGKPAESPKGE